MSSLNDIPPLYNRQDIFGYHLIAKLLLAFACLFTPFVLGGWRDNTTWVAVLVIFVCVSCALHLWMQFRFTRINSQFRLALAADWCYWSAREEIDLIIDAGGHHSLVMRRVQEALQEIRRRQSAVPQSNHFATGQVAHPNTGLVSTNPVQQS